jgi:hypothetical protein
VHGRTLLVTDELQLPPLSTSGSVTRQSRFITQPLQQGESLASPSPTWVRDPVLVWHFEDSTSDANLRYLQVILTESVYGPKGLTPYRGQPRDLSSLLVVSQGTIMWRPRSALVTQCVLTVTNRGASTLTLRLLEQVWGYNVLQAGVDAPRQPLVQLAGSET